MGILQQMCTTEDGPRFIQVRASNLALCGTRGGEDSFGSTGPGLSLNGDSKPTQNTKKRHKSTMSGLGTKKQAARKLSSGTLLCTFPRKTRLERSPVAGAFAFINNATRISATVNVQKAWAESEQGSV